MRGGGFDERGAGAKAQAVATTNSAVPQRIGPTQGVARSWFATSIET